MSALVCYTAIFSVVTQGGALRDDSKNCCVADYVRPHHTNVCKFSQLCVAITLLSRLRRISFKFGIFTNFKALFPVVSTDFP